jgi:hypothetical protein
VPEVLGRLREPQVPVAGRHLLHQGECLGQADVPVGDRDAEDVDRLARDDVLELRVPDGIPVVGNPPGPHEILTETAEEIDATAALIRDLRDITEPMPGRFRASAFEYRPYPGTPDWTRLIATGRYTPAELLNYSAVDLTGDGLDEAMRERDEFNFSVNIQLSDAPIGYVRRQLVAIAREQWARSHGAAA